MTKKLYHTIHEAVAATEFLQAFHRQVSHYSHLNCDDICQEAICRGLIAEEKGNYKSELGSPMVYLLAIAIRLQIRAFKQAELLRRYQLRTEHLASVRQPLNQITLNEFKERVQRVVAGFPADYARLLVEDEDPDSPPHGPRSSTERARKARMIREIKAAIPDWEGYLDEL